MSDHPQFNFPIFDAVAGLLRGHDVEVVSPAELDAPESRERMLASPDGRIDRAYGKDETWGGFLARDVKLIADEVEAVAVLPEWWTSPGARLEAYTAFASDKPVRTAYSLLFPYEPGSWLSYADLVDGCFGVRPFNADREPTLRQFRVMLGLPTPEESARIARQGKTELPV